jgi:hypothetical protein
VGGLGARGAGEHHAHLYQPASARSGLRLVEEEEEGSGAAGQGGAVRHELSQVYYGAASVSPCGGLAASWGGGRGCAGGSWLPSTAALQGNCWLSC